MNVLILSASRKVWLVDAFREALGGTGRVLAADVSPDAAALYRADEGLLVPRSDEPGFVDHLLEVCRGRGVGLVVPTRDEELGLLARAVPRFEQAGVRVVVSPPAAIETCQDKQRFAAFCERHGFAIPEIVSSPRAEDLPLFVRPRRGKGGVGARAIRAAEDLPGLDGDDVVISRYVDAPEHTVDVFFDRHGVGVSAVARIRVQVVAGESQVTRTVDDPELCRSSLQLCEAIGIVGPATVQAFRTADRPLFIEVNPRFGGASALSFRAGAPSPTWLVRESHGETIDPQLGAYQSDLTLLRYGSDLFVEPGGLLA